MAREIIEGWKIKKRFIFFKDLFLQLLLSDYFLISCFFLSFTFKSKKYSYRNPITDPPNRKKQAERILKDANNKERKIVNK